MIPVTETPLVLGERVERFDVRGRISTFPRDGDARRATIPIAIVGLVALVGLFYMVTLRPGHNWGDDFAMYIMQARNLAHGHLHAATGYIYNPAFSAVGPRAYPPIFPLLLAPVVAIWGMRFAPMKVEIILFFMAALLATYFLFRRELSRLAIATLIAIIGFSPYFWGAKDEVLSDIPFLLVVLLAILAIRANMENVSTDPSWRHGALVGATCWLAFGMRTIGVVLIPCLLLAEWNARRRLTRNSLWALMSFGFLALCQRLTFGGGQGSYFDQLKPTWTTISSNIAALPGEVQALWTTGHPNTLTAALFFIASALMLFGLAARLARRITILEIFPLVYFAAVLLWPSVGGTRFLIPLIPFFVFFAATGAVAIRRVVRKRAPAVIIALSCVLLIFSYGLAYGTADYGPIKVGVSQPDASSFFRFIETNTARDAVFVFKRPRALALFTHRRASVFDRGDDPLKNWRYFESIHARYLALGPEDGRDVLAATISRYRSNLRLIYRDGPFRIYRVVTYS